MMPFDEFCAHYQLDPACADSRAQYDAYCANLALFRRAMLEQQEAGTQPQADQQTPIDQGGEA